MRRNIILAASSITCLVLACAHTAATTTSSSTESLCNVGQNKTIRTFNPPVVPKYFFKPAGKWDSSNNEITFVGYNEKSGEDQNFILNFTDNKITQIPGRLDPISLFGTDLVSIPLDDGKGGLHMTFYDLRELRVHGIETKPLLAPDDTLNGRYQSMAVLSKQKNKIKFRIFTDGHHGGDFRDFEVDFNFTPAHLRPLTKAKMICPELRETSTGDLHFKLPILSKNGHTISGFDYDRQEMKLLEFNPTRGSCTDLHQSVGHGDIGKLDFSVNRSTVVFHYSDRNLDFTPLTFGHPKISWRLRASIYDLKNDTHQLLPFTEPDTNNYYPAFLPNGHVMFLQMSLNKTDSAQDAFQFVEVNPTSLPTITTADFDRLRNLSEEEIKPYQLLLQEWAQTCSARKSKKDDVKLYHSVLDLLSLTRTQCESLAKGNEKLKTTCASLATQ